MLRNNLKYYPIAALLNLSSLILMICGLPPPAVAQAQITMPVEVLPGPPDLAALCSASKNYVEGDSKDSADITITVQNLLTPPQYPHVYTGKVQLLGSEARQVTLEVKVSKPLSLSGNISPAGLCIHDHNVPEYFVCGALSFNTITIPAGGSTKIDFRVTADSGCCPKIDIEAKADHLDAVKNEPSETNNVARCEILVWRID